MPDLRWIVAEKWKGWKESALEYRCMIRPCVIIFAVYVIGISAILRANFNYRDDLMRGYHGIGGWDNYGRYISNILSCVIHGDTYLTDVSPLPQVLAALLMAAAAVIVWYIFSEDKRFNFGNLAALVPLGLSPYFLQCFSYKYDAPYMALSVLVSVAPLLFWKYGYWKFFCGAAIGSLAMCLTYQASSGIFPMLVAMICFIKWNCGDKIREILTFVLYSAGGYILGMAIFKIFLMPKADTYVSTSLPSFREIVPVVGGNLGRYFRYIETDFKIEWLELILLLCLGFVFVMVRDSVKRWYAALLMSILILFVMLVFSFGLYPIFSKPLFAPRAMYGFGIFLVLIGTAVSVAAKAYPAKASCIILAWCFFVFSFTYGNALREQQDYADFRIAAVINDLNSLDIMVDNSKKEMQLTGSIGHAPVVKNMSKHNRMIKRLVPTQFQARMRPEEWKFFHYYGFKKVKWNWYKKTDEDFRELNLPIVKDTMYHTIRGKDDRVLVELK